MADLQIRTTYAVCFSPEEFRLISKALRRELTESEVGPAEDLQAKLLTMRAKVADQFAEESEKAVDNINQTVVGRPYKGGR